MSNSTIKLVIIITSFVITGAIYFMFISPQWNEVSGLRSDLSSRNEEHSKMEELRQTFDTLKAKYVNMVEDGLGDEINAIIPRREEIPEVLVQLEAIAAQTGSGGVVMRKIDFGIKSAQTKDALGILTIDVQLSASYEAFKEYLNRISKNMRLFDITAFSFSSKISEEEAVEGEEKIYDFQFKASAYFQK